MVWLQCPLNRVAACVVLGHLYPSDGFGLLTWSKETKTAKILPIGKIKAVFSLKIAFKGRREPKFWADILPIGKIQSPHEDALGLRPLYTRPNESNFANWQN
jgi:hypothetical protein